MCGHAHAQTICRGVVSEVLSIQFFTQQIVKNFVKAVHAILYVPIRSFTVTKEYRYLATVAIYSLNWLDSSVNGIYCL